MRELFPQAHAKVNYAIGPSLDISVDTEPQFTPDDLEAIRVKMREIVDADYPLFRRRLDIDEAIQLFERDGQELGVDVPVSPVLAALGGTVEVPTPDGAATLKIPAGTPDNKLFRLRGKGVPSLRGGSPGDLTVRIVFEVPSNLGRKEREALEAFQKIASESNFPQAQRFASRTRIFYAHKEKLKKQS